MTVFRQVQRLTVHRRFASGETRRVGELAQNRQGVFFQYDADYLRAGPSLSPFMLSADGSLQAAPRAPHSGLHGVFADSLPDGWGMRVMDRVFRRNGVLPTELTPMDRLSYIGDRGMGALRFEPVSPFAPDSPGDVDLAELGERARALFEDEEREEALGALAVTGSSGGARPKALVYLADSGAGRASTRPGDGLSAWLVKFTSASLPLGHEESLCEAVYLRLAAEAGIETPDWRLLPARETSSAIASLAVRRFDCTSDGRLHMHTLCGLLDADFRTPSMDYEDLIKASQALCRSPAVGRSQFVRAVFNLFAVNQDDHTRNWAFLQDDDGEWRPSPCYDVTFSPSPYGEHATAFVGHGNAPPRKAMQRLAAQANYASWSQAREVIQCVVDVIQRWTTVAAGLGVRAETVRLIGDRLEAVRLANRELLTQ